MLRYADDVNGSLDRVAGVANEDGNVLGLMPHPEHAVDPLLGPTGGGRSSRGCSRLLGSGSRSAQRADPKHDRHSA